MATKLNKKFLTVISLFAFVALAVVGGIAYLQVSGAPERNKNLGDIAMTAGEAALAAGDAKEAKKQFTEAMNRYGRAVSKRPNNVQYIDLMRGALERIVPDTGSEASELYQRWLSVIQQRVRAKPEDAQARMAFIEAVQRRAELVGTPETWKSVSNVCDDALAALPPGDPSLGAIRRIRADAEVRRDSVLTEDDRVGRSHHEHVRGRHAPAERGPPGGCAAPPQGARRDAGQGAGRSALEPRRDACGV